VVRNAVFLLRRMKDPGLMTRLPDLLDHGEPKVVAEAIEALASAGDERWLEGIRGLFAREESAATIEALAVASRHPEPVVGRILLERLRLQKGGRLREPETLELIRVLGGFAQDDVAEALYDLATKSNLMVPYRLTPVWEAVAEAAARLPSPAGERILEAIVGHRDPAAEAARALLERRQEGSP
jgi:hypothetical protein